MMNAIADALVFAAAYIGTAPANDDREDVDCAALEGIGAILTSASAQERQLLRDAAERAITEESASLAPRQDLLAAYRAFIESYLDEF